MVQNRWQADERGRGRGDWRNAGSDRAWNEDRQREESSHRDDRGGRRRAYGNRDGGFEDVRGRGASGYGAPSCGRGDDDWFASSYDTPHGLRRLDGPAGQDDRDGWGSDFEPGREERDRRWRDERPARHRHAERGFWDRASDEVASWFGNPDAERRREEDQFRGRGPKGYTRSDERIREDVSDRLTDDPGVDASNIEVSVAGGEVTLSGTVTSRNQRRRAEDCTEYVSGVTHIQNNIRVKEPAPPSIGQAAFGRDASETGEAVPPADRRTER